MLKTISICFSGLIVLGLTACGVSQKDTDSNVNFIKTSENKAYIEQRDLNDTFLFGLNVTEVNGFFSSALNLNISPMPVKLVLGKTPEGQLRLVVGSVNGLDKGQYMSFDVQQVGQGYEVNFASVGNEIELYNHLGGQHVPHDGDKAAPWQTVGAPKTEKVYQDGDLIVADVRHNIQYTGSYGGQTILKTGNVKLRMYLKREKELTPGRSLTVAQARAQNIGFFPSTRYVEKTENLPIAHYDVNVSSKKEGQIVVYLKDFPNEFVETAARAILSWNVAFGFNAIQVRIATSDIDVGDPRYHVVKWFNGLGEDISWAGYAPTAVDPYTGKVLHAQIFVNGDNVVARRRLLADGTAKAIEGYRLLKGRIGNIPVVEGAGETPVVSFFTDPSMSQEEYVQRYYFSVIMHEFGHSLGLRHNFAASTKLDNQQTASSVMDYEPGWSSARRTAIGSYDLAAIRLGYFGQSQANGNHVFCTDEDMSSLYYCNQGDFGDPAASTAATLMNGAAILSTIPFQLPADSAPLEGTMMTALKIYSLAAQIPADRREAQKSMLIEALKSVRDAKVDASLQGESKKIAIYNVAKLRFSYKGIMDAIERRNSANSIVASHQ